MKHQPNGRGVDLVNALRTDARAQSGVLHWKQLHHRGVTSQAIRAWINAGWLDERFRWTVTFPGTPTTQQVTAWSAVLSAGGNAALTASHALALMDLAAPYRDPLVLRSDGRVRKQPNLNVRWVTTLPDAEVTDAFGPRTTSFARAMLDAAGVRGWDGLDRALDRSVKLRLYDGFTLERVIADHRRSPGRPLLEAAIERLDANAGRVRSELERRLLALIISSNLPTPVVNAILLGFEVDFHWLRTRAIVEADGREHHSSPAEIAHDEARRATLRAAGYEILLIDWWSVVYRPQETLERIRRFVEANTAPPVPRTLEPVPLAR